MEFDGNGYELLYLHYCQFMYVNPARAFIGDLSLHPDTVVKAMHWLPTHPFK